MMKENAPVFVKIEDYRQMLDVVEMIKKNLKEAKQMLADLNQLKEQETSEILSWSSELEQMESKIEDINKLMFQPDKNW
jgi:predicted  nucleic acid-binding Zn-ribbon protein